VGSESKAAMTASLFRVIFLGALMASLDLIWTAKPRADSPG
jgi:hypothetical protein